MKRRDFLNKVAIGTASGVGVVSIIAGINEILPPDAASYSIIKVGKIDDFPLNEFSFIPDKKIYVYRTRRLVRVLSAVCTHLGCTIQKSENGFRCPCHGSIFDVAGKACSGPATRSLDRLKVSIDKHGLVTINLNQTVDSDLMLS